MQSDIGLKNSFWSELGKISNKQQGEIEISLVRDKHTQVLPDELIARIFTLLAPEIRLKVIPLVCYQFYKVSLPQNAPYPLLNPLAHKIGNMLGSLFKRVPAFYACIFKEDARDMQFFSMKFPGGHSKQELYQNWLQGLSDTIADKMTDDSLLNLMETINEWSVALGEHPCKVESYTSLLSGEINSFTTPFKNSLDGHATPARSFWMEALQLIAQFLIEFSKETVSSIATILIEYSQGILLGAPLDIRQLVKKLLSTFNQTERQSLDKVIAAIEPALPDSIDQKLNSLISTHADAEKIIGSFILNFASAPHAKIVQKIQDGISQKIEETFTYLDPQKTIVFVDFGQNSVWDNQLSNMQVILHPNAREELRWLANRALLKAKKYGF